MYSVIMAISLLLFLFTLLSIHQEAISKRLPIKPKLDMLPGRLVPSVDFVKNCENISSLVFRTLNARMKTVGSSVVVDADFLSTRPIETLTKVILYIYNCEDRASGSCQLFQTWRYGKEACEMAGLKNQLWSPIYRNFNPRLKCPNPAGQYFLRNGTMDMEILRRLPFPLEKYYWRVRLECYDTELCFCNVAGGKVLRSLN